MLRVEVNLQDKLCLESTAKPLGISYNFIFKKIANKQLLFLSGGWMDEKSYAMGWGAMFGIWKNERISQLGLPGTSVTLKHWYRFTLWHFCKISHA
jgi:hypothetical protein